MIAAPLLVNDLERVQSLRRLNLLSTPREADFDCIVRLAQKLFGTEIVLISLIDSERQWFKAKLGLDVFETPRDISFCGHAIEQRRALVVEDATADRRFHDNPLVTGDPKIRFYAGQPISMPDGNAAGTLCVISPRPRAIGTAELEALADLGRLAEIVIGSRRLGENQCALLDELAERQRDSLLDPLTGLWNRRGYDRLLAAELALAARHGETLALAVVDIDNFKKINDAFGHAIGDRALAHTADLLTRAVRPDDIVARFGGEEFTIIARGIDRRALGARLGESIVRIFREYGKVATASGEAPFTVSVGIAAAGFGVDEAATAESLFAAADDALYAAKSSGKDRYHLAATELAVAAIDRP